MEEKYNIPMTKMTKNQLNSLSKKNLKIKRNPKKMSLIIFFFKEKTTYLAL